LRATFIIPPRSATFKKCFAHILASVWHMATFIWQKMRKNLFIRPKKDKITMPVKQSHALAFVRCSTLISEQLPMPNQAPLQNHFANQEQSLQLYSTSLEIVKYAAKWTQKNEDSQTVVPCRIQDVFFLLTVTAGKVNEKIGEAYQKASNHYKKARGDLAVAVLAFGVGALVAAPEPFNPFSILIMSIGAYASFRSIHHFSMGLSGMKRVREETKGELTAALYERGVLHTRLMKEE
jgi:hypothetical protein